MSSPEITTTSVSLTKSSATVPDTIKMDPKMLLIIRNKY